MTPVDIKEEVKPIAPLLFTETAKKPAAVFADQGFKSTHISDYVRHSAQLYGTFSDIELARITHIIDSEFNDIINTRVFTHIDLLQQTVNRTNTMLMDALQTDIINDINNTLSHILNIIHGDSGGKVKQVVASIITFITDKEEVVNNMHIPILLQSITNTYIPQARVVSEKLRDVIYYAKVDIQQLRIYLAAGELKLKSLEVNATPNDMQLGADYKHTISIFSRKLDSITTQLSTVTTTMMQAQTVLHTLDHMMVTVESTVLVSIPAYMRELQFMHTMNKLKDAAFIQEFKKYKNAAINDLNKVILKRGNDGYDNKSTTTI
jgi:hypothetical protein